jgi:hypothetical protein
MKFKIVRDCTKGFEVRGRKWYGLYRQLPCGSDNWNSFSTVEEAERFIENYAKKMLENRVKRKIYGTPVKTVEVDTEQLVAWKLQGKI